MASAVLIQTRDTAEHLVTLHQSAFAFYRRMNLLICITAIVLSAVGGAASIANTESHAVSIAFGAISLTAGVLFAIHRYLGLPELQKAHDIYRNLCGGLVQHINLHTSLLTTQATAKTYTTTDELAKECSRRMESIQSGMPSVPGWIQKKHAKPLKSHPIITNP